MLAAAFPSRVLLAVCITRSDNSCAADDDDMVEEAEAARTASLLNDSSRMM